MLPRQGSLLFRLLLLPCLGMLATLAVLDGSLRGPASPLGIVSLQLCGLTGGCEAILQDWRPAQRDVANLSLGLDFLYLVLYAAEIALALVLLAPRLPPWMRPGARAVAWLMPAVAGADAVENVLLLRMLATNEVAPWALPAALCAAAKFAVLAVALSWLLVGVALVLAERWRAARPGAPQPPTA